ncbi:sulfate adenylyltransferase subunit 1 [Ostreibacterium oceani]|uniref:sulfate adenylyltransferase n=1 Tax=Ostreibacterium oceani TaxID=2654998 RepID=A0A6N7EXQ6_9GAMM|nr:GTP-binding protein [Ostreibacterium oceani]MPV86375.1 GTP-binding protein [Ostreibacterium oceani]
MKTQSSQQSADKASKQEANKRETSERKENHRVEISAEQAAEAEIEVYLRQHQAKDMLRFLTCGSVDDGKSTLIGRLLYDSQAIFEDQLAAITRQPKRYIKQQVKQQADEANQAALSATQAVTQTATIDLASLVDGLQSEQAQGITIDVAYRYFTTDKRKFIIADCPGHEEYTRNMVTGASHCDAAIVIIDARKGIQTQTRRHSYLCDLLGIKQLIVAVNKMDLIDYDKTQYDKICEDYQLAARAFRFESIVFIPVSALLGDNVVAPTCHMPWYGGLPLLATLESIPLAKQSTKAPLRFPVQWVSRPHADFRGYAGTVASGRVGVGDVVQNVTSGQQAHIASIVTYAGEQPYAYQGDAITLTLSNELDVTRGDMLVHADDIGADDIDTNDKVGISNQFIVDLVWLAKQSIRLGQWYWLKIGSKLVTAKITELQTEVDVNQQQVKPFAAQATSTLNRIFTAKIALVESIGVDAYDTIPATGSAILIDRQTHATVAAVMVREVLATDEAELNATDSFEQALAELITRYYPHWDEKAIAQFKSALAQWDCRL